MHTLLTAELIRTLTGERRDEAEAYSQRLAKVTIGELARVAGPIELAEHDPRWSEMYLQHAARVVRALDRRALRIDHVGSTSIPGLPAKPIIDIALVVADAARESRYLPDLGQAGYRLRIREPEWFEHRMCSDHDGTANLHVFSAGCDEVQRMIRFRDWLRRNPADRDLYARAKQELAARDWDYVQQYADAKSEVITAILARSSTTESTSH